jgi:fructose-specific component phosphotransferase system IIB-like protein
MKLNRNDDICPICGKAMYIGKIDKACADPECEMGQGELAYIKRQIADNAVVKRLKHRGR